MRVGVLPAMLRQVLDTRWEIQAAMRHRAHAHAAKDKHSTATNKNNNNNSNNSYNNDAANEADDEYDDDYGAQLCEEERALKLLANVSYGYTAASHTGRMPCLELAEAIVALGRQTLERAVALVHENSGGEWPGARVVYGDTDSLFVQLPGGHSRETVFRLGRAMARAVTASNPAPICLRLDKVLYPCFLVVKKRYAGMMWERTGQAAPRYFARGIETERRDQCPLTARLVRRLLTCYMTHSMDWATFQAVPNETTNTEPTTTSNRMNNTTTTTDSHNFDPTTNHTGSNNTSIHDTHEVHSVAGHVRPTAHSTRNYLPDRTAQPAVTTTVWSHAQCEQALRALYTAAARALIRGQVNPCETVIYRAVRLGRCRRASHIPWAARVALRAMSRDVAQTPYWGERVCYVVLARGSGRGTANQTAHSVPRRRGRPARHCAPTPEPGRLSASRLSLSVLVHTPTVDRLRGRRLSTPQALLYLNTAESIDAGYYLRHHINPALQRILYLANMPVGQWYAELSRRSGVRVGGDGGGARAGVCRAWRWQQWMHRSASFTSCAASEMNNWNEEETDAVAVVTAKKKLLCQRTARRWWEKVERSADVGATYAERITRRRVRSSPAASSCVVVPEEEEDEEGEGEQRGTAEVYEVSDTHEEDDDDEDEEAEEEMCVESGRDDARVCASLSASSASSSCGHERRRGTVTLDAFQTSAVCVCCEQHTVTSAQRRGDAEVWRRVRECERRWPAHATTRAWSTRHYCNARERRVSYVSRTWDAPPPGQGTRLLSFDNGLDSLQHVRHNRSRACNNDNNTNNCNPGDGVLRSEHHCGNDASEEKGVPPVCASCWSDPLRLYHHVSTRYAQVGMRLRDVEACCRCCIGGGGYLSCQHRHELDTSNRAGALKGTEGGGRSGRRRCAAAAVPRELLAAALDPDAADSERWRTRLGVGTCMGCVSVSCPLSFEKTELTARLWELRTVQWYLQEVL